MNFSISTSVHVVPNSSSCRRNAIRTTRAKRSDHGKPLRCQASFLTNMFPGRAEKNPRGDLINVGTTERPLLISRMGCGTWSWGNQLLWGYENTPEQDAQLEDVFNCCLDNGVNLFDTGDSYGTGKLEGQAETLLGRFSARRGLTGKEIPNTICIATKLAAYPWRLTRGSMVKAIQSSAERLGREDGSLELGQMHWSPASYGFGFQERALIDGLCEAYDQGIIRGVGLSNFGPKSLRKIHRRLAESGVPISTLQTQFSLLSFLEYQRETKEACDELGITLISYSPLCLGLLSGNYTSQGDGVYPKGPRGILARRLLPGAESSGLLPTLREIAQSKSTTRQEVSTSQVALAWCMAKDTVPIPGAKSVEQCQSNLAAMRLKLSAGDVAVLDEAAMRVKTPMVQNSMASM